MANGDYHPGLVSEIVKDNITGPDQAEGFNRFGHKAVGRSDPAPGLCARGRIEGDPTGAGEIGLDPGVSVALADRVGPADVVPLALLEPGHHPGRNSEDPEQHRHAAREVLAVPLPPGKEEVLERSR